MIGLGSVQATIKPSGEDVVGVRMLQDQQRQIVAPTVGVEQNRDREQGISGSAAGGCP